MHISYGSNSKQKLFPEKQQFGIGYPAYNKKKDWSNTA
jgi:hypothetical protein